MNKGVFIAWERGVVTSASLMVCQAAAPAAARGAAERPELAVGLHLDLGDRDYESGGRLSHPRCNAEDPVAVEVECRAQLERFRTLVGRDPTHLDSHHHVHRSPPASEVAEAIAVELGVPLRGRTLHYEGGFYGQSGDGGPFPEGIAPQRLVHLIGNLPPGWSEIGCHPAAGPVPTSSYDSERQVELRALCDPRVAAALPGTGVQLRSFAELPGGAFPAV